MAFFDSLEAIDRTIFFLVNGNNNLLWDDIMVWISNKKSWIPFYALLLIPLWHLFGKKIYFPLVSIGLLILLADQSSVHLFKNVFERYRPCHNLEIMDMVHIVNGKCGGKFGFLSSHATNSFALAVFLSLQFRRRIKWLVVVLYAWAAITAYSRVYLGVHYPSDVLAGALLGTGIALLVNKMMVFWMNNKVKTDQ